MISVLDYGVGNIASVMNALRFVDLDCRVVQTPGDVAASDRMLLPGVGAFAPAITRLRERGLDDALSEHVRTRGRPLLGICLGMQLLLDQSLEAGIHRGLGLVAGVVRPLGPIAPGLVVPHVGWNDVVPTRASLLLDEYSAGSCYFVHGYYCDLQAPADAIALTTYGSAFPSMLQVENVFGCQFHPEKSQRTGLGILRRFGSA